MAAFASPIHEARSLKIGYQFADFWRHVYASVVSSFNAAGERPAKPGRSSGGLGFSRMRH